MPIEQGVLTLRGNVYTAYTYEEKSFKVAEATDLLIHMEQTLVDASKIPTGQLEIPERQVPRKHIKPNEHKEIQLVDDDPSKTASSGPTWILNRKTHSLGSRGTTSACSRGNPLTCPAFLGT
jgi:hypothetical protein